MKNYRNYEEIFIDFNDKLNIVIGDNAQGKTNLLESIYVLAVTKSFLSITDKNLIMFDKKYSLIKGILSKFNSLTELEVLINENGKIVKSNKKELRRLRDYISKMNVIIFSSNSIRVFKDGPSSRRKYFNIQISQLNRSYLDNLSNYNVLLRQRNEFLKRININKKSDRDYLEIIDNKYAELSLSLFKFRMRYVDLINKYIDDIFYSITNLHGLKLVYNSNISNFDKNILVDKLKSSLVRDVNYKMTFIGPNRDDFYFELDNKNLSLYGSQGQVRCAVLALKLAEVNLFKEILMDSPILLLDDIFSELDIKKRNNILDYLDDNIQVIITTTDVENINKDIRDRASIYEIKNGKLFLENDLMQEGDENE